MRCLETETKDEARKDRGGFDRGLNPGPEKGCTREHIHRGKVREESGSITQDHWR